MVKQPLAVLLFSFDSFVVKFLALAGFKSCYIVEKRLGENERKSITFVMFLRDDL